MRRQSDPSMKAHFIYVPSSPYEPGIQSHLNDLGDPRYVAMTGRDFTSHHAGSTPDLRVEERGSPGFHQQGPLPLKDIYHNHGNLEYSKTGSRDSLWSPLGEVERSERLVSRSMSDLSNLGNDSRIFLRLFKVRLNIQVMEVFHDVKGHFTHSLVKAQRFTIADGACDRREVFLISPPAFPLLAPFTRFPRLADPHPPPHSLVTSSHNRHQLLNSPLVVHLLNLTPVLASPIFR